MSALEHDNDGPGDGWCGDATSVVEFLRPLREQLDAPGVLEPVGLPAVPFPGSDEYPRLAVFGIS